MRSLIDTQMKNESQQRPFCFLQNGVQTFTDFLCVSAVEKSKLYKAIVAIRTDKTFGRLPWCI